MRDHCHETTCLERPNIGRIYISLQLNLSPETMCLESQIFAANWVVLQDRFYCIGYHLPDSKCNIGLITNYLSPTAPNISSKLVLPDGGHIGNERVDRSNITPRISRKFSNIRTPTEYQMHPYQQVLICDDFVDCDTVQPFA